MRSTDIAVGITTCEREPSTYVETRESIEEAGFNVAYVQKDVNKELGSYGCFKKVLEALIQKSAEAVLIFQDDIEVTRNLATILEKIITPKIWNDRTGVISLYTACAHHNETGGWHKLDPCKGSNFYGALAVLLPMPVARHFIAAPPGPGAMTLTDFWLGTFCESLHLDVWMPSPSFVYHTGTVSTIENMWPKDHIAKYRQCYAFCADALAMDLNLSAFTQLRSADALRPSTTSYPSPGQSRSEHPL